MKKIILGLLMLVSVLFISVQAQATTELEPFYYGTTPIYHRGTTNPVMIPKTYEEKTEEFRGVWVATVFNLNMPTHSSESQYKAAYEELIARVKSKNMNAILFQTRPLNDAFYESEYAPFSRYLTGTEGKDPGWDVMEYMVSYAHSQGIEFHAWMNPYRVANSALSKEDYLSTLHDDNFAKQNPDYVINGNISGTTPYILDPGRPEVQQYIQNVVREILEKYDVDGVHFDDYFYPYDGMQNYVDQETYSLHNPNNLNRADWRRSNVDTVVKGVKEVVDGHNALNNKTAKFGISPFGIWRNKGSDYRGSNSSGMQSYDTQYADSRKWVLEGWVHYITPQVYWQFNTSAAPYADIVDWWAELVSGTNVDLIVGHSITSSGLRADEMQLQLRYNQKYDVIKGEVFYSAGLPGGATDYLNRPVMNNVVANYWTHPTTNFNLTSELNAFYGASLAKPGFQVEEDLNLVDTLGDHQITWTSSASNIINPTTGKVSRRIYTRPANDLTATLTATNQHGETVSYELSVPAIVNAPTFTITGEKEEDTYKLPVTIAFEAPETLDITYSYTDGETESQILNYTEPFSFDGEENKIYTFTVTATNPTTQISSNPLIFTVASSLSEDVKAARNQLQSLIDEAEAFLEIEVTDVTDPYKLNLGTTYTSFDNLETLILAMNAAKATLGVVKSVEATNVDYENLGLAIDVFNTHLIIGQGEIETEEKLVKQQHLETLLEEITNLMEPLTGSDKAPSALPFGKYISVSLFNEANDFIYELQQQLNQPFIKEADMDLMIEEGNDLKEDIISGIFEGTNQEALDALVSEIEALIKDLEDKLASLEVSTETNPALLEKGKTYISKALYDEIEEYINTLKEAVGEANETQLETYQSQLNTYETQIEENVNIGQKEPKKSSGSLYIIIGSIAGVLVIAALGVFFVVKKKK